MTDTESVVVNKPLMDDREYRYIQLPNGIEALLVQDPTTDMAAAALDVGVGSLSDPEGLDGLAHFLEHLLFMGTEKYPDEAEFTEYLYSHGGNRNAYTEYDRTNYFFSVNWMHLKGALDRFSQFFIAPLFSESVVEREIMAINSESTLYVKRDNCRFSMVLQHLCNPNHPYHKYRVGNYETLGSGPRERGIDIRQRLIDFYKTHYTSGIMKLAIVGREDLDTLQQWAYGFFGKVPDAHPELASTPPFYADISVLRPKEELEKLTKVEPVMDSNIARFIFVIPDQSPFYDTQPYKYYAHLLSRESEGSLGYYLKTQKWITSLTCTRDYTFQGADSLRVNAALTGEGINHWHDVAEALFTYIKMVRDAGPQQWIFDEIMRAEKASFLYRQKSSYIMWFAGELAKTMQFPVPRERILDWDVPTKYNEDLICDFGKYLVPENMWALMASKSFTDLENTEPWSGAKYSVSSIPPIEISDQLIKEGIFHLPRVNDFLPEKFGLVRETSNPPPAPQNRPRLLIDNKELRLWHKLDDTFKVPKANIFVKLIWADVTSTLLNSGVAELFVSLIKDKLSDYADYAAVAGVSSRIAVKNDGFQLEVQGLSEKLDKLLEIVVKTFCEADINAERFEVIKEKEIRWLNSFLLADPRQQIWKNVDLLLSEHEYSVKLAIEKLKDIQFKDIDKLTQKMRSDGMGIEMLVVGNLNSDQARRFAELVQSITAKISDISTSVDATDHAHPTSYVYDPGMELYYETTLQDPDNVISFFGAFYMFGEEKTVELSAMSSLFVQMLRAIAFEQLRTKEQLGYSVYSVKQEFPASDILIIGCVSAYPTHLLEARVENFIVNVAHPFLLNMSKEEFQKYVDATVDDLLKSFKNLEEEASHYWSACNKGTYDFSIKQRMAKAVSNFSQSEVVAAFDKFFLNKKTRRRLALHLKAKKQTQDESKVESIMSQTPDYSGPIGTKIDDLDKYYSSVRLGPRPEPVESLKTFEAYELK